MPHPTPAGRNAIAGGSGFLGLNPARALAAHDCQVVLISRNAPAATGPWTHATWNGRTVGDWANHLDNASAVVNLAGRTVDCIKTPDHCDEVLMAEEGFAFEFSELDGAMADLFKRM